MLEKEFQYYNDNQPDLFKQFPKQYIAINNQKVIGVYGSKIDAYIQTLEEHELGSFLVQFCSLDQQNFIQSVTSNLMIA